VREQKVQPEIISYRALRKSLGWLGISLPVVLILGQAWVLAGPLMSSLSSYYHTGMRNWFVGSLCAMAVFFACYQGYDGWENGLTNLAGVAALGVAFCPTAPAGATGADVVLGRIHIVSAAVLFLALAGMAWMFAQDKPHGLPRTRERQRKRTVYLTCAAIMVASIVLMVILGPIHAVAAYRPMLWLESLTILAFGVSWLVKGLVPREPLPVGASVGGSVGPGEVAAQVSDA
jgi:hypothetical protein